MNLVAVMRQFSTQNACIAHLEKIRWSHSPSCPRCESENVARKTVRGKTGEWNCHLCKSTFNVLTGTMFQGTKVELQKWFLAISLIANAKKSLSSHQLARDLGLTQPTALYMQHRIRAEMGRKNSPLLQGIIEADEAYIGGKPRKRNKRKNDEPPTKRGRGTKKTPVIGAVERGGNVQARVQTDLSGRGILRFLKGKITLKMPNSLRTNMGHTGQFAHISRTKSSITKCNMWMAIFTPTRLRGSGHFSSALGMAAIITIPRK